MNKQTESALKMVIEAIETHNEHPEFNGFFKDKMQEVLNACKLALNELGINETGKDKALSDDEILRLADGYLDCVDEEYIKVFSRVIEKACKEALTQPSCGFNRNASHNAGEILCDCGEKK